VNADPIPNKDENDKFVSLSGASSGEINGRIKKKIIPIPIANNMYSISLISKSTRPISPGCFGFMWALLFENKN
jgi:hypothetical protein